MMSMNRVFLDTADKIDENQYEYTLLNALCRKFENEIFILEIEDINSVPSSLSTIEKYISDNYKTFEIRKFVLNKNNEIKYEQIFDFSSPSLKEIELTNKAIEFSSASESIFLVNSDLETSVIKRGKYDEEFNYINKSREKLDKDKKNRYGLDDLDCVFEYYQVNRKHSKCDFIKEGKIINNISEQILRNDLISFLKQKTSLQVVQEYCTSCTSDETSVDISLIDYNNRTSIVEVKFFIDKNYFENEANRSKYGCKRFKDGYIQLNKYCKDLVREHPGDLHSAYLYMFYAHSKSKEDILGESEKYYKEAKEEGNMSQEFEQRFKDTILDSII